MQGYTRFLCEQIQSHAVFNVTTFIALVYIVLFKAKTTIRLGKFNYPGDVIHIASSVFRVNYGMFVLNLPRMWGEVLARYPSPSILAVGVILYLVIFFYLYSIAANQKADFPSRKWLRNLTLASFVIFLLGYAIFFTNNKVGFSPTGVDNRVAIAAAVGVAISLVGGIGYITRRLLP